MSEFYIVTSQAYDQHATLDVAQRAQRVLQRHFPDKVFTIYRCKRWLMGARHFKKLVELLTDILAQGLTPELQDRARILLFTINYRDRPNTKVIPRVEGPPEFQPRAP